MYTYRNYKTSYKKQVAATAFSIHKMGTPPLTKSTAISSLSLAIFFAATVFILSSAPVEAQEPDEFNLTELKLTPWQMNVTYNGTINYNPRGMAPLYKITNEILGWFIGKQAIPDDYIIVTEGNVDYGPKVKDNAWGDLLKHYWGILLVIVLTGLLVVLMPIIGLCFCCCRCAGACGGRSQPFDKKHDTCRRAFLGLLLICLTTGILFGVVVAFVTNSYMQEGVEEATTAVRHGSSDTVKYLQTTSSQIDHLLVDNYKELSEHVEVIVREASNKVIDRLEENFKAVSLVYISTFVRKLPDIRDNLEKMKSITNELRVTASQLSDGLRGVKRELLVTLTKCETQACKDVLKKYEIGKLDANGIDYNQLPDLSEIIDSVNNLIQEDVTSSITQGQNALDSMRRRINETVESSIKRVSSNLNKAGQDIQKSSNEIKGTLQKISATITNNTDKGANMADYYIEQYSMYRFYVGIGISSILLLVLICLVLALFCGICGKRPEGYGDDCCNKGSGSRFLMLGVTIIFLTTSVLAAAALIHFLAGLILHRAVCVPLTNPESDQIFNYIDNFVDLNHVLYQNNKKSLTTKTPKNYKADIPFRISNIIIDCKNNQSIYEVLRLYNYINIEEVLEYPKEYKIDEALDNLIKSFESETNITIITPKAEEKIKILAKSELKQFDKDKFSDNLNETITKYSLRDIAIQLRDTALKVTSPEMSDVRATLRNQALHLESYQDKLVVPMIKHTNELLDMANQLEEDLRYNGQPFEESMFLLLEEIQKAQTFINTKRTEFLERYVTKLIEVFKGVIDTYLKYVARAVQDDIGVCEPMLNVYKSMFVATCNKVVDPFNGFWAGVGWCVLLFLPSLVISVMLSSLYQKSESYPGPLVESEYLYDAYSERDNIPLANGPKNKRRKTKERRRGSRDRRGDYYEDTGSAHGAPAGRDTRYSDMAPRHWDGGPPRYQNPPMAPPASEYERPPPYYYPGAPSEHE